MRALCFSQPPNHPSTTHIFPNYPTPHPPSHPPTNPPVAAGGCWLVAAKNTLQARLGKTLDRLDGFFLILIKGGGDGSNSKLHITIYYNGLFCGQIFIWAHWKPVLV